VSEPALQPVHITIKQFGVTDGTEQHVELAVAADRTLNELFAQIGPEHRSARGLTWRFQIGERQLDWSIRLDTLMAEYAGSRHVPGGVLWLDLWYFADRPVGNDFTLRTPGSASGFGPRSSDSNLPTLPDMALPAAPPAAEALPGVAPLPPRAVTRPGARPVPLPAPRPLPAPAPPADEDEDAEEDAEEAPVPRPGRVGHGEKARRKARPGRVEEDALVADVRRTAERRATVRYYTRMNPDRMFPLLVILSERQVQEVVKARVGQASSESFKVDEGSVVEIEPVLPGCDCYPPRLPLAVEADGPSTATIWVVPKVLGRVQGARVLIRQGGRVLAEVPLDVKVAKQTLAIACGLMSLAAPYLTMGLKSLKLDYESQKAGGFPIYQQIGSLLAEYLRPEWIGLSFLGLAAVLYLLMRPKRRDVFWDVNLKE
jgi:hypothetical protein